MAALAATERTSTPHRLQPAQLHRPRVQRLPQKILENAAIYRGAEQEGENGEMPPVALKRWRHNVFAADKILTHTHSLAV